MDSVRKRRVEIIEGKRECARCHLMVAIDDFVSTKTKHGVTSYQWCKLCSKTYANAHYKKKPPRIIERSLRLQKRDIVHKLKEAPCMDCGRNFPPECMDFDHVRGVKSYNIAVMMNRRFPIEEMLDEIAKCELVCACCHRTRSLLRGRSAKEGLAISRGQGRSRVRHVETGIIYESCAEASRALNINAGYISAAALGKIIKKTMGQHFEYIDENDGK